MMNSYNPDVLSCLANLSNDEVFTPPEVANAMLDLLPQELFSDPNTTFLDPACKSGVFLREIAKRLLDGLLPGWKQRVKTIDTKKSFGEPLTSEEEAFQEKLQSTLDHIFHKQLFGIAITELTSLLSRRSVYCSKYPNSKYSVSRFDDPSGNIRYKRIRHRWQNKKCVFCGASQGEYDRDSSLESHAYEFIHTTKSEKLFNMKFDVIIGNPPYQLSDGGAQASAIPIYQKFVDVAKRLNPRFLSMIIPARWFAGGRGLDSFRSDMLHDRRIRYLDDYFNAEDCFPGIDISGGVCYFLWDRDNFGECEIVSHLPQATTTMIRPLLEEGASTYIRFNQAVEIYRKVCLREGFASFSSIVSSQKPFGLRTYILGDAFSEKKSIRIYSNRNTTKEVGYVSIDEIVQNRDWVNKYKVLVSSAYGERGEFPYHVIGKPFIAEKNTCCSETYLVIGVSDSKNECKNITTYMSTKFFRLLVLLQKNTQHAPARVYSFVPMQDFSKPWTDEELYAKYGLTDEEIAFIESMIKPMELGGDGDE